MRQLFRQSIFSALARHRLLLGVVVSVTLIQITVSLWGIQAVQQQVVHSVSAIVQSRVAQLENNFASLSGPETTAGNTNPAFSFRAGTF